jgi:hypothetical protein
MVRTHFSSQQCVDDIVMAVLERHVQRRETLLVDRVDCA